MNKLPQSMICWRICLEKRVQIPTNIGLRAKQNTCVNDASKNLSALFYVFLRHGFHTHKQGGGVSVYKLNKYNSPEKWKHMYAYTLTHTHITLKCKVNQILLLWDHTPRYTLQGLNNLHKHWKLKGSNYM